MFALLSGPFFLVLYQHSEEPGVSQHLFLHVACHPRERFPTLTEGGSVECPWTLDGPCLLFPYRLFHASPSAGSRESVLCLASRSLCSLGKVLRRHGRVYLLRKESKARSVFGLLKRCFVGGLPASTRIGKKSIQGFRTVLCSGLWRDCDSFFSDRELIP